SPVNYEILDALEQFDKLNFYLSYSDEFDKLMIIFYQMSGEYSAEKDEFKIYYIDNELSFSKGNSNEIENIYINAKNEFDILGNSKESSVKVINNHFIKRDKTNYSISREPTSNMTVKDSELASLQGSLINNAKIKLNNNGAICLFSAAIKCEIKKTIEANEYVKEHVKKILSYNKNDNYTFEDIYYARVDLGKTKDGYWENIRNEETDFACYYIF
ncbi:TPA: hypothetical protein U2J86_005175, partial [Serratia marcescens]|nr:hypothetical protein [Serratia marcescens]